MPLNMSMAQRTAMMQQAAMAQRSRIAAVGSLKTPVEAEQDQLLAKCEAISGDLRKALVAMQGKVRNANVPWVCMVQRLRKAVFSSCPWSAIGGAGSKQVHHILGTPLVATGKTTGKQSSKLANLTWIPRALRSAVQGRWRVLQRSGRDGRVVSQPRAGTGTSALLFKGLFCCLL